MESLSRKELNESIPQAFRLHGILANETTYATDSDDEIESWDDTDSEDDSSDVDHDSSNQDDNQVDSSQDDTDSEGDSNDVNQDDKQIDSGQDDTDSNECNDADRGDHRVDLDQDDTGSESDSNDVNQGDRRVDSDEDYNEGDQLYVPLAFEKLTFESQLTRKLKKQPNDICFNSILRRGLWVVDPCLSMKKYQGGFFCQLANVCFQANLRECSHEQCKNVKKSMHQLAPSCSWEPFRQWALTAMSCQASMDDNQKLTRAHTHIARAVSGCFKVLKFHLKKNSVSESDGFDKADVTEVVNLMYWMTRIQAELGTPPAKISDWDHHFVPFKYTIKSVQRAAQEVAKLGICKNRLWNLVNVSDRKHGDLPDIVMSLSSCGKPLAHEEHNICTPSMCQGAHMDSTKVEQLHKCEEKACEQRYFPVELLATNIEVGKSTAWVCNTRKAAPRLNFTNKPYIAISHVWSDGTGVGVKDAGSVNKCLYDFFERTALRLDCEALWWDAISIPQEVKARIKAMKDMHSNYVNAKYTVVHDSYLLNFPWSDDGSPCLALVLSTWFTRGWTALELAMAQNVKVLFKDPDVTKTEPIIKDLDEDVLAKSPKSSTRAHWLATCLVQRLRRPVEHIGDLVAVLGPRSTSWARDRTIIASLLAGVPDVDLTQGESVITTQILEYLGGYSWSPATLDDMPIEVIGGMQKVDDDTVETMLDIDDNGSLWGVCACRKIQEKEVLNGMIKPYGDSLAATIKVNLALASSSTCLLVRPSARNKDPRCLLVVPIGLLQDGPTLKCRYIGTVLEDKIGDYGLKKNILIGGYDSDKTQPLDASMALDSWLWAYNGGGDCDDFIFNSEGEMELIIKKEENKEENHGVVHDPQASDHAMQNDSWASQQVTESADGLETLEFDEPENRQDMTSESLCLALRCKNRSATRFLVSRGVTVDLDDFIRVVSYKDSRYFPEYRAMKMARYLSLLGDVYMEHGKVKNAIEAYERVLQERHHMAGDYEKSTRLAQVKLSLGRALLIPRQETEHGSQDLEASSTKADGSESGVSESDGLESEFQLDLNGPDRAKGLFKSIVKQGEERSNVRSVAANRPGDEGDADANTTMLKASDNKEDRFPSNLRRTKTIPISADDSGKAKEVTRRDERRALKFLQLELDAVAELIVLAVGEFRFDEASEFYTKAVRHFVTIPNIALCEGFKPRWIERKTVEARVKESRDKDAASIYHRVLKRLSILFKKHHLLIIVTQLHLGVNCIFRSEFRDAVVYLSEALHSLTCHSSKEIQGRGGYNIQSIIRPDHPLITLTRYHLGHVYLEQDRFPKAKDELLRAREVIPPEGQDSMAVRNVIKIDLARCYLKCEGESPLEALKVLETIFAEYESLIAGKPGEQAFSSTASEITDQAGDQPTPQLSNERDTQALASKNELYARLEIEARFIQAKAVWHSVTPGQDRQKAYDLAVEITEKALQKTRDQPHYKSQSDLDEEKFLSFHSKMAEDLGHIVDALRCRESALEILNRVEGEHSLSWLRGAIVLARIYNTLHVNYRDSETLLKKAIQGLENDLGEYSTMTLKTCQSLGEFYLGYNHTDKAEQYCTRAFEGFVKARGVTFKHTLNAALILGKVLSRNFKYTKAKEVLFAAHVGYKNEAKQSAEVHKRYIAATRELAECFAALGGPGNERIAIDYNKMILDYLCEHGKARSKDYYEVLLQQGNLRRQLREFGVAEDQIRQAINFFEECEQPGFTPDQEIEISKYEGYFRLGELILDMQRLDVSREGYAGEKGNPEELIVEAHEGLKRILGEEDLRTIQSSVLRGELCLDHDVLEDPQRDHYLHESLESCRRVLPPGTPMTIRIMDRLINYWVDNKGPQDKIDSVKNMKLEDLQKGYGQDTAVAIMKMTDLKRENLFSLEVMAPEHHYEEEYQRNGELNEGDSVEDEDLSVWNHPSMQNNYAIQNQTQQTLGLQIGEKLGGLVHAGITFPFDVVQGFVTATLTGVVGEAQQNGTREVPAANLQPSYAPETPNTQTTDQRVMPPQSMVQPSHIPEAPVAQMVDQGEMAPLPLVQPLFHTGAAIMQLPFVGVQSFLDGFQQGYGSPGQDFSGQSQASSGYQYNMTPAYQEENNPPADHMVQDERQGYGNQNTNQNVNGGWFGFGGFGG
ncbi:hypothetical protein ACLX1H_003298 [Fusarium chlamydosporum]